MSGVPSKLYHASERSLAHEPVRMRYELLRRAGETLGLNRLGDTPYLPRSPPSSQERVSLHTCRTFRLFFGKVCTVERVEWIRGKRRCKALFGAKIWAHVS